MKDPIASIALFALLLSVVLLGGLFVIPWSGITWGTLHYAPASVVTVSGIAKTEQKNQIASFTGGVTVVNDSKEAAIDEVNRKVEGIIAAVKNFGIPAADIKTANINIYQGQEQFYEDNRQKMRAGQWNVSNNVEIKLKDVERASQLADLLAQTGATNVYGPNFMVDDTASTELTLIDEAIKDAKVKAEKMAAATGRTLGKTLTVTEGGIGGGVYPVFAGDRGGGGGGAAIEPGTQTVSKTVTVTFELK